MVFRRALLAVLGLAFVAVLGFVGLFASAFWVNAPLPDGADLPGGARLVKDGIVAAFVVPVGGTSLALVDCGSDPEAKAILAEIARRGARREDVKAILLTHGHGDHVAGCHQFPGAEVMGLAGDAALAAGTEYGRAGFSRFLRNSPPKTARLARVLRDGETVQVGAVPVRVFAVPGHTDGGAAFLAGGVLYLGDSATVRKDGKFAGALRVFSVSVEQNRAALRALWTRLREEKLAVEVLAPSHSAPQAGTAAYAAFAAGAP